MNKLFVSMTEKLKKKNDLKGHHNLIPFYFVYMWWTPPPF